MSTILCAVIWSVVILFIVISVQASAGILNNGLGWGFGARDTSKDDTVLQSRAKRTVANQIESMMLFVPLALVAHMKGIDDPMLMKGAWVYIIARAVYPLTYWTGMPYIRTLVWFVGIIGTAMVGLTLL